MRVFLGTLVVAAALSPAAGASYPDCALVTDAPPNPLGVYALLDPWSGSELWLETNQAPGLQRETCIRDDGTIALRDTPLLDVTA